MTDFKSKTTIGTGPQDLGTPMAPGNPLSYIGCRARAFGWPATARSAPDSFADLAQKLLPAVVNISTTSATKAQEGAPQLLISTRIPIRRLFSRIF